MNDEELKSRLKQLKIEDFIWFIYIGIIIISWYSNSLEEKYFLYHDIKSKEKYRNNMIFIFTILVIIYIYFLKDSFHDLKSLKISDSKKKKDLTYLSFLFFLLY